MITITTTHDTPLFDPEDHRKLAAELLKADPAAIHCTVAGPDTFDVISEAAYSEPLFSEDGTVLRAAELLSPRVVHYHRCTTWELRPTVQRDPEPEPVIAPPLTHHIPKLSRGARWHGIIDGVEGHYISTGKELVLLDSADGLAVISAMHREQVPHKAGTGG